MPYFEITGNHSPSISYLGRIVNDRPLLGYRFLTKLALDVNRNEVNRVFWLNTERCIQQISLIAPGPTDRFRFDLYPDTVGNVPAMTAQEWANGSALEPILVSLFRSIPFVSIKRPREAGSFVKRR